MANIRNTGPDLRGEPQGIITEATPLPLLTVAAQLANSGGASEEINNLLRSLLVEEVDKRKKNAEKRERMLRSNAMAAKEQALAKEQAQNQCTHRDQLNESRLAGQVLSGTGQLNLVCKWCHKSYYNPPLEGQEAAPRELLPRAEAMGR